MPRITNWLEVEKRLSEQNVNIKNAEDRIVKTDNSLKFMLQALLINLKDLYDSQSEISLWFYDIDKPTTSTLPYTSWDDPSEHYGDFFYSRTKGIIYKFNEQGEWEQLNDATLLNAMALTNSKLEAGDHERKVFLDDPTTPYDSGDWWVKEDGTLFICQIGRQDGTRMPNDFINSLDYAENLAIATGNMMEVLKGTVITVTDQAVTYLDKATNTTTTISGNSIKTGELISNNYVPRTSGTKISLNDGTIDTKNFKISANGTLSIVGYATDGDIARIESEIGEVTDVTKTNETSTGYVEFTDINISEPIRIEIHPTSEDITALHPKVGLHPRVGLRPHSRQLYFENTTDGTSRNYNLPHDLLYLNSNIYDEFLLDFENAICRVTQRVGILNGNKYELPEPIIKDYVYHTIGLTQGDYKITLKSNRTAYMKITLMTYNMYTTQYSTKYETKSAINQSSNEIRAEVAATYFTQEGAERLSSEISANATEIGLRLKTNDFTNAEITAKLNDGTSTVKLSADKINLSGYLTITSANNTYASKDGLSSGTTIIDGGCLQTGYIKSTNYVQNSKGTRISLTTGEIDTKNFKVSSNGTLTITGYASESSLRAGTTTISGGCITTGTIDASRVSVTNLNASNITTGTLSASKISGGSLNLTGTNTTITSTNFSVTKDGAITSKSGTIGGFTIASSKLYNGKSSISASTAGVYIGTDGISLGSGNTFKVTSAGVLNCSNIFATGGQIGGIDLNQNGLSYSGDSSDVGFGLWKNGVHQSFGSSIIFHAGGNNSNIGGAKFRVFADGTMVADKAYINGAISSSTISGSTISGSTINGGTINVARMNLTQYNSSITYNGNELFNGTYTFIDGNGNHVYFAIFNGLIVQIGAY